MPREQGGICAEGNLHGLYLMFNASEGAEVGLPRVIAGIAAWLQASADRNADCAFNGFIAVGANYWDSLYSEARPAELAPFPQFEAEDRLAPSQPVDLFVHIRSDRLDVNHVAATEVCRRLTGLAELVEEVRGFRYLDNRDLTGFVDGTENPVGPGRREVALVGSEDPAFAGGSYIHTQRYVHNMAMWEQQSLKTQEDTIGRSKMDNVEYPSEAKPMFAHIKRTNLKHPDGRSMEILRQSMPYGNMQEQGLFFISCCKTPGHFTAQLKSMVVGEHGHFDHLLKYTQAVTGAAYFAPSLDFLERSAGL
ncbi:Dyp-type peroxidase [Ferrimonas marina]|uniref:Putative iron-dependent peroxidase n=1 Tax=Ferrimonas marina TaxID=299255 RepID=A0A1M5ZPE4_9GAMM|nr:Dyp-type peroxidase [Ferrimonas marina]SHI26082.1 putative iron-dependent peroxidase [Ferrimonas marina]